MLTFRFLKYRREEETDSQMDAALLVEEETSSAGAVDDTNDTQNTQSTSSLDLSSLRQKEDSEEHGHEGQEDGKVVEMDEREHQISREEDEENKPESEMSPKGTDMQEEDMISNREDCWQGLKDNEDVAEEKSNTSEEEEPQVTSVSSLQQEPDGDLKEESTEHEHVELKRKDEKLDDGKEAGEKEVHERNMEGTDFQTVTATSEKSEEMEHESSEQCQESRVPDVKEEKKQDGLAETALSGVEDATGDRSDGIAMDVSTTEEKMEVADPEGAEPFVNVGKGSDKNKKRAVTGVVKMQHRCKELSFDWSLWSETLSGYFCDHVS